MKDGDSIFWLWVSDLELQIAVTKVPWIKWYLIGKKRALLEVLAFLDD